MNIDIIGKYIFKNISGVLFFSKLLIKYTLIYVIKNINIIPNHIVDDFLFILFFSFFIFNFSIYSLKNIFAKFIILLFILKKRFQNQFPLIIL